MTPTLEYVYNASSKEWRAPRRNPVVVTPPVDPGEPWEPGGRPEEHTTGWEGIGSPTLTPYAPGVYGTNHNNVTLINRSIAGDLTFRGTNITLIGCRITGKLSFYGSDSVAEDCTFGRFSSSGGKRIRLSRVSIFGLNGEDSLHITSDSGRCEDFLLEDSYVGMHDTLNPGQHFDGIQVRGLDRGILRGNYFDCAPRDGNGDYYKSNRITAAVFFENAQGGNDDILVENNWLRSGGSFVIRMYSTNTVVKNNIFYSGTNPNIEDSFPFEESGNTDELGNPIVLQ